MPSSQRRTDSGSEGINSINRGGGTHVRLKALTIHDVDAPIEQTGDVLIDLNILINPNRRVGVYFDHDICVAVRPIVAARAGAEQCRMANAPRAQGRSFSRSLAMMS